MKVSPLSCFSFFCNWLQIFGIEYNIWTASLKINTRVGEKDEQEKQAKTYLRDWLLNGSNMTRLKALLLLAWFIANAPSYGCPSASNVSQLWIHYFVMQSENAAGLVYSLLLSETVVLTCLFSAGSLSRPPCEAPSCLWSYTSQSLCACACGIVLQ